MKPSSFSRLHIALSVLILMIMAGCSSHKNTSNTPFEGSGATTPTTTPSKAPEAVDLADTYRHWTSFYAPFSMELSQPLSFNLSGRATMVNGEAVNLSLRILGMEVAIVYIDKNEAILVDKFHKQYVKAPLASLTSRTDITLADLQAILLGQAVYPGKGALNSGMKPEKLFSMSPQDEGWIMTPKKANEKVTWYFTVVPGPRLSSLTVEPKGMEAIQATFSDFVEGLAGAVASEINVKGSFKSRKLNFSLEWNMGKAEWDGSRTASAPSVTGYKELSLEQIIKSLKNK